MYQAPTKSLLEASNDVESRGWMSIQDDEASSVFESYQKFMRHSSNKLLSSNSSLSSLTTDEAGHEHAAANPNQAQSKQSDASQFSENTYIRQKNEKMLRLQMLNNLRRRGHGDPATRLDDETPRESAAEGKPIKKPTKLHEWYVYQALNNGNGNIQSDKYVKDHYLCHPLSLDFIDPVINNKYDEYLYFIDAFALLAFQLLTPLFIILTIGYVETTYLLFSSSSSSSSLDIFPYDNIIFFIIINISCVMTITYCCKYIYFIKHEKWSKHLQRNIYGLLSYPSNHHHHQKKRKKIDHHHHHIASSSSPHHHSNNNDDNMIKDDDHLPHDNTPRTQTTIFASPRDTHHVSSSSPHHDHHQDHHNQDHHHDHHNTSSSSSSVAKKRRSRGPAPVVAVSATPVDHHNNNDNNDDDKNMSSYDIPSSYTFISLLGNSTLFMTLENLLEAGINRYISNLMHLEKILSYYYTCTCIINLFKQHHHHQADDNSTYVNPPPIIISSSPIIDNKLLSSSLYDEEYIPPPQHHIVAPHIINDDNHDHIDDDDDDTIVKDRHKEVSPAIIISNDHHQHHNIIINNNISHQRQNSAKIINEQGSKAGQSLYSSSTLRSSLGFNAKASTMFIFFAIFTNALYMFIISYMDRCTFICTSTGLPILYISFMIFYPILLHLSISIRWKTTFLLECVSKLFLFAIVVIVYDKRQESSTDLIIGLCLLGFIWICALLPNLYLTHCKLLQLFIARELAIKVRLQLERAMMEENPLDLLA